MAVKIAAVKLTDAVDRYLRWCETAAGMAPATMSTKRYSLRCLTEAMTKYLNTDYVWLSQVDAPALGDAFSDPEGAVLRRRDSRTGPKKASSVNQIRADWKAFLAYCRENGWLAPGSPMSLVRKLPVDVREDWLYLNADEIQQVPTMSQYEPHQMLMAFQVYGGSRVSEAEIVRYGDLLVQPGHFRSYIGKVHRVVMKPISEQLQDRLDGWLPTLEAMHGRPLEPRDALCPALWYKKPAVGLFAPDRNYSIPDPTKAMTTGTGTVKAALRRMGYDRVGEASHVLRRSAARLLHDELVAAGVPAGDVVSAVMAFLAHREPRTTLRYIGREPGQLALERAIMGRHMYGPRRPVGGTVSDLGAAREAKRYG